MREGPSVRLGAMTKPAPPDAASTPTPTPIAVSTVTMNMAMGCLSVRMVSYPMGWNEAIKPATVLAGPSDAASTSQATRPFETTSSASHSP